ncbi:RNA polymerase sigma factor [Sphingomonas flavalba]|uniref:RNA polymerase sigma factor n=1 Tax=Sphingomonas flavalba TaxID=2559804 RepID=UPI0039DFA251
MGAQPRIDYQQLSDPALAERIAARDPAAVRLVTTRHNQRLFRVAYGILKHRGDSEDVLQNAYLKAFAAIGGFRGDSALSTWLTRIVINEALERRRRKLRETALAQGSVVMLDEYREKLAGGARPQPDAELAQHQIRVLLEQAVSRLPDDFRLVFVLREIEGVSVDETARLLDILPATVKTRHLRARRRLQKDLGPQLRAALHGSFPFAGLACEAMTERVVGAFCGETGEP